MEGFRSASAPTLADARRLAGRVKPSAVLLNHLLPDGPGTSVCGDLRRQAGDALPIVVVTGVDPREIELGRRDGPDAVMGKPCRPDLLTALLTLLVTRDCAAPAAADADAR